MVPIYARIRKRARKIVSQFPTPDFYQDFKKEIEVSRTFFYKNHIIAELHAYIAKNIDNDFGHGLEHSLKVTIEAGALTLIESRFLGLPDQYSDQRILIVQCAGLLHDIKRKKKDHAVQGAAFARNFLKSFPLHNKEVDKISSAIRNHEAFKTPIDIKNAEGALISDCLYDADKFRWGPDNFKNTIWEMISYSNPPLSKFIDYYPEGMKGLEKIKDTFRTNTGKKYGPQFIDLGLAIGNELYNVITQEFVPYRHK